MQPFFFGPPALLEAITRGPPCSGGRLETHLACPFKLLSQNEFTACKSKMGYGHKKCRLLGHALSGMLAGLLIAYCVLIIAPPAYAEIRVTGTADSIRIVAERAPLETVLSAVSASYQFRYRSSVPLDEIISGTYSGSPETVVSRLVASYNYFIKRHGLAFEVFVLSRCDQPAGAAQASAHPVAVATQVSQSGREQRRR
jgi:hypothetical protein